MVEDESRQQRAIPGKSHILVEPTRQLEYISKKERSQEPAFMSGLSDVSCGRV